MFDKDDIEEIEVRWKVLALFEDGHVMEIEENMSTDKTTEQRNTLLGNKKPSYCLRDYLVNKNLKKTIIPGKIKNIFRNNTNRSGAPIFEVEKKEG